MPWYDCVLTINSPLNSTLFTIVVGPEEECYSIHQSALSQSPVFKAMTEQPFKEKEEQIIRLPDDEPVYIEVMLRYLYAGNIILEKEAHYRIDDDAVKERDLARFLGLMTTGTREPNEAIVAKQTTEDIESENRFNWSPRALDIAEDLAQIYVLGDKYLLPQLKLCALQKLQTYIHGWSHPIEFLNIVSFLKSAIPGVDEAVTQWVRYEFEEAACNAAHAGEEGREALRSYISRHGLIELQVGYTMHGEWLASLTDPWGLAQPGSEELIEWLVDRLAETYDFAIPEILARRR